MSSSVVDECRSDKGHHSSKIFEIECECDWFDSTTATNNDFSFTSKTNQFNFQLFQSTDFTCQWFGRKTNAEFHSITTIISYLFSKPFVGEWKLSESIFENSVCCLYTNACWHVKIFVHTTFVHQMPTDSVQSESIWIHHKLVRHITLNMQSCCWRRKTFSTSGTIIIHAFKSLIEKHFENIWIAWSFSLAILHKCKALQWHSINGIRNSMHFSLTYCFWFFCRNPYGSIECSSPYPF